MGLFSQREEMRKRLNEIVEKFRQKGAVSPDKAMTAQDLGLPPRFEEAMHRRLGQTGIFIQVDGKYYLSEERLKQFEEQRRSRGAGGGARRGMLTLKITRLITIVLVVILFAVNIFVQSYEIRLITFALVLFWIIVLVVQIIYFARARKGFQKPQGLS